MNHLSFTRVLPVLVAISAGCLLVGPAVAQPLNFGVRC